MTSAVFASSNCTPSRAGANCAPIASSVPVEKRESKDFLAIGAATDSQVDGENPDRRATKEYQAEVDHPDSRERGEQLARPEMLDHLDHREKSSRSKDPLERRDQMVLTVEREALLDLKAMKDDVAETATLENMDPSDPRPSAVNNLPITNLTRLKKVMRKISPKNTNATVPNTKKNRNTIVINTKNRNTMVTTNTKNRNTTRPKSPITQTMITIGNGRKVTKSPKAIHGNAKMAPSGRATKRPTTKFLRAMLTKKRLLLPLKILPRIQPPSDPAEPVKMRRRVRKSDSNFLPQLITLSMPFFFVIFSLTT